MQELQLDPYTYTPQLALQLGTIQSVDFEKAVVQRMERYEAEAEDQPGGLEPEIVITLTDLYKAGGSYRVVQQLA